MKALAEHLQQYFWETDLSKINLEKNREYIIERILELGDSDAVQWLFSTFSLIEITTTINNSRRISKKSINFWKIFLKNRTNV